MSDGRILTPPGSEADEIRAVPEQTPADVRQVVIDFYPNEQLNVRFNPKQWPNPEMILVVIDAAKRKIEAILKKQEAMETIRDMQSQQQANAIAASVMNGKGQPARRR